MWIWFYSIIIVSYKRSELLFERLFSEYGVRGISLNLLLLDLGGLMSLFS